MRLRTLTVSCGALALALVVPAVPALAHEADAHKTVRAALPALAEEGTGTDSMAHVANLEYQTLQEGAASNGSDIEFVKIGGREYALSGTLRQGLQIVDITDPTTPVQHGHYACPINQGDVQVFPADGRVLATYTADSRLNTAAGWETSQCVEEIRAKGVALNGNELGTFLVDITDPAKPFTVSFMAVPSGSHNMSVHPSGDFLYNSNSDLITSTSPKITIFDISNPEQPRQVQEYAIPFVPASLGSESHDVFFNEDGTRGYSAALSQTLILDTTDPANPTMVSQILDPEINVVHQSDVVTLTREDGTERDVLIITDERAGAAGAAECPGGGLHVYDVTDEANPAKMGTWFIDEIEPVTNLGACTSHVLRIHPEQELLTIAWYIKGVRVLDIAGLADFEPTLPGELTVAYGDGVGMTEVGSFAFPDSDTWSFKTNKIAADGSFFGYGNDLVRGLDVFRFAGLDREVPPLEPVDLAPAAKTSKPNKGNGKGKPDRGALLPFLPTGSGPTSAALLLLLGVGVVAANGAVVRRSNRGTATPA